MPEHWFARQASEPTPADAGHAGAGHAGAGRAGAGHANAATTTTIDCDRCTVRGIDCSDCVVSFLLGGPPPEVAASYTLSTDERQALDVLSAAGLVPPLRMVDARDPVPWSTEA